MKGMNRVAFFDFLKRRKKAKTEVEMPSGESKAAPQEMTDATFAAIFEPESAGRLKRIGELSEKYHFGQEPITYAKAAFVGKKGASEAAPPETCREQSAPKTSSESVAMPEPDTAPEPASLEKPDVYTYYTKEEDVPAYYTKIVEMFADELLKAGYTEPTYHKTVYRRHEDAPSTFVTEFYDEHGTKRKEYIYSYHHVLERLTAWDEKGVCVGSMVTTVARKIPGAFYISMYTCADNNQAKRETKQAKRESYVLSVIDLSITPYTD